MAKRMASVGPECVACGCCAKVCPTQAIKVYKGLAALVDTESCIGCGKCARECPAGVINMISREKMKAVEEKETVLA